MTPSDLMTPSEDETDSRPIITINPAITKLQDELYATLAMYCAVKTMDYYYENAFCCKTVIRCPVMLATASFC